MSVVLSPFVGDLAVPGVTAVTSHESLPEPEFCCTAFASTSALEPGTCAKEAKLVDWIEFVTRGEVTGALVAALGVLDLSKLEVSMLIFADWPNIGVFEADGGAIEPAVAGVELRPGSPVTTGASI